MGCKAEKPKQKHKKGLWSPDEDQKLRDYILRHGHGCWSSVPVNAGLQRNGKSCRLRWINYLRPGLKRGVFSIEEEETVLALHGMLGNKWSQISQHLPGRTDNEIKNHWHSYLKKRVSKQNIISSTTIADHDENTSSAAGGGGGGSLGNLLESSFSPNSPSLVPKSSTTQNSAVFLESIEQHLDQGSSSTDTEPSVSLQHMEYFPADHHHHQGHVSLMPKILFAEWLSMDTFREQLQNAPIINYVGKHNFDYYNNNSDFQDAFMLINHHDDDQRLFLQEGNFGSSHVDINHRGGGGGGSGQLIGSNDVVTVDNNNNNMIQTIPKFEGDHFSENGFVDFISGQFNLTSDDLYL